MFCWAAAADPLTPFKVVESDIAQAGLAAHFLAGLSEAANPLLRIAKL
ncbi:hypothetical protein [Cupriavidus basilensis]